MSKSVSAHVKMRDNMLCLKSLELFCYKIIPNYNNYLKYKGIICLIYFSHGFYMLNILTCLFELQFYGPVNTIKVMSCQSVN